MPIYTFNFSSSAILGETRVFRQQIQLPTRPPRGARFFIRQVSVYATDNISNSFKYVNLYIPELMGVTQQTNFINFTVDAAGNTQLGSNTEKGFRFYLTDIVNEPFMINYFPNLNLGRHDLTNYTLTLELTPYRGVNLLGSIFSYSIVLEWDTE